MLNLKQILKQNVQNVLDNTKKINQKICNKWELNKQKHPRSKTQKISLKIIEENFLNLKKDMFIEIQEV